MLSQPPLILALDLATISGYAIGRAGARPRYGKWRLKHAEDGQATAGRNLACQLINEFRFEKPDLVVIEAPLDPSVKLGRGDSRTSVTLAWRLQGAVDAICGAYTVRQKPANVQSVRLSVLGTGRPDNPKQAVIDFVNKYGFPTKDDNEADAILMWMDEVGFRQGLDIEKALPR